VCRHHLPSLQEHIACVTDGGLRDIERVLIVLREAECNCDLVLAGGNLDQLHLR
jgi:hypothetical protein